MKRDKIKPWMETPIRFLYPTSDDWHPSIGRMCMHHYRDWDPYPRFTSFLCNVRIGVHLYYNPDKVGAFTTDCIRITVCGDDDTMMGKNIYLPISEYEAKLKEIKHWCEHLLPNPLTMEWLKTQGFRFE